MPHFGELKCRLFHFAGCRFGGGNTLRCDHVAREHVPVSGVAGIPGLERCWSRASDGDCNCIFLRSYRRQNNAVKSQQASQHSIPMLTAGQRQQYSLLFPFKTACQLFVFRNLPLPLLCQLIHLRSSPSTHTKSVVLKFHRHIGIFGLRFTLLETFHPRMRPSLLSRGV